MRHPESGTLQSVCATKTFVLDKGDSVVSVVQANSMDSLVRRCYEIDGFHTLRPYPIHDIVISKRELNSIVNNNIHLETQVTELQQLLTLKEEQLRTHRRVKLSDEQLELLKLDLEETTNAVRAKYSKPI